MNSRVGWGGIDDDAEEIGLGFAEFGGLVDAEGGVEEVEEERKDEEGGEEDEAFVSIGRRRRGFGVGIEDGARVELSAVGWDVGR